MRDWLIYGAYGFTGELVARHAVANGNHPVLAGRDGAKVRALADELGLEHRVCDLSNTSDLLKMLEDAACVVHVAGPYSATGSIMVDACLQGGTHYVDVCGELDPLAAVLARGEEAVQRNVALLPGNGTVMPSDCLLATALKALPDATRAEVSFTASDVLSRGTMRTVVETLDSPSLAVVAGILVEAPRDRYDRRVDYGDGTPRRVFATTWSDLVSARHTAPQLYDVSTFADVSHAMARAAQVTRVLARTPGVGRALRGGMTWVANRTTTPKESMLDQRPGRLHVLLSNDAGETVEGTLLIPNPYLLAARAVVRVAQHAADGLARPGAHTPSQAHGSGFVTTFADVIMDCPRRPNPSKST